MKRSLIAIISILMFVFLSCGESSTGTNDYDKITTKLIKAVEGGTIESADGLAKIDIPADALESDTNITIQKRDPSKYPDKENLGSNIYDFGPDGLQFRKMPH